MRGLIAASILLLSLPLTAAETDMAAAVAALDNPASQLLDVRSADEFASGALPGAKRIEHSQIAAQIASVVPDKDTVIVLYCRSGRRSSMAQDSLADLGYRNVINGGGYDELSAALEQQQ